MNCFYYTVFAKIIQQIFRIIRRIKFNVPPLPDSQTQHPFVASFLPIVLPPLPNSLLIAITLFILMSRFISLPLSSLYVWKIKNTAIKNVSISDSGMEYNTPSSPNLRGNRVQWNHLLFCHSAVNTVETASSTHA